MIRSIKYDSIRKIIVLSCNFLLFSSFLLKHILNNANVMNVLCFYKKKKKKKKKKKDKRFRENKIIGRDYDLISRPFCSVLLLSAPFFLHPNVLFRQQLHIHYQNNKNATGSTLQPFLSLCWLPQKLFALLQFS